MFHIDQGHLSSFKFFYRNSGGRLRSVVSQDLFVQGIFCGESFFAAAVEERLNVGQILNEVMDSPVRETAADAAAAVAAAALDLRQDQDQKNLRPWQNQPPVLSTWGWVGGSLERA